MTNFSVTITIDSAMLDGESIKIQMGPTVSKMILQENS